MEAGSVEINLIPGVYFQDKKVFRITFSARSSGTLSKLTGFKVDDYYEFLTDPETFCTSWVTKKELEGKRKREIEVVYLPETRQLHIRDVDLAVSPPVVKKDTYIESVPPCVQDVFSAVYSLRTREISSDTRIRAMVGDNDRFKELESRVEKREILETPSGRYDTWRLNTISLMGGLFRQGGQFKIWLTADARKVPVQFEAKVSLGKVTGRLIQFGAINTPGLSGADHKPSSVSPRR